MHIQNLVKFYQFVLKILSENEILISVKGHKSVSNMQKMMCLNSANLFSKILSENEILISVKGHKSVSNMQKMMCLNSANLFSKILSGKENLTSIKGHNSVTNLGKMTANNLNLDLVNTNAHTKFGQILSISSQD